MGRYCIYLRKSRADLEAEAHGEGETLLRHRNALTEFARRHNIPISKIYQEIVSGDTIAARPEMQKLLSEVGEGTWDGVLVMEVERLARGDTMDQGLVAQAFKYSGTKIITPLKTYDPTNEFDEEYFEFGLFMARRELTTINRRLQRGRAASAKEGKFLGSRAPYGYKRKKIENDKGTTLEIVKEHAEVVRMIFDWYVNGTEINGEKKRIGMQAIAHKLNEMNIPPATKDYWLKSVIKGILTNPTYAGRIRWGYRKVRKTVGLDGKKTSRPINYNDDCIISEGLHEAIVPPEIFDKAQELISEIPPAPVGYKSEVKNPLAGLIFCAKCGRSMVYRRKTKDKGDPAIVCHARGCPNISTPYPYVEERILNTLRGWAAEYNVTKKQQAEQQRSNEILEKSLDAAKKEIETLKKRLSRAYELVEDGTYTKDEFTQRSTEIKLQIEDAEERIKKITAEHTLALQQQKAIEEFVPAIKHLLEVYDTLSAADKNTMLKEIIDHAVYEKNVSGVYRNTSPDNFTLSVYPRLPKYGE